VVAGELYSQEGSPCRTCSCSYMSLKPGAGTSLGFDAGAGLTLRVCRVGRDPIVAEGGTEALWCEDYKGFSELLPLTGDELDRLQAECSRGFLGDLAQGIRPLPRGVEDLRWYDRGLREGWLPPHRIEVRDEGDHERIKGPWEQFVVVGLTPAYGDGHTPALAELVLQARDRRTYLLLEQADSAEVRGLAQTHSWWVSQVSSGAATPLEHPVAASQGARALVLRGGERALSPHAWRYLAPEALDEELDRLAEEALRSAEAALRRKNSVVAELCIARGLRARPDDARLLAIAGSRSPS